MISEGTGLVVMVRAPCNVNEKSFFVLVISDSSEKTSQSSKIKRAQNIPALKLMGTFIRRKIVLGHRLVHGDGYRT